MGRRGMVCAAVLALVIAGCGDGPEEASEQAGGTGEHGGQAAAGGGHGEPGHHDENSAVVPGARTIAVEARSFAYEPATFSVAAGEDVTIALTATDTLHDFNVEGAAVHVAADSGETAKGGLRIAEPGTYTVYCSVPGHRESGMEGTLTVQPV